MLHNYFIIAWRNIRKNKIFSLINIFGLAIGIAFALLISAYIWSEYQVNKHLNNADDQYITLAKWKDPNMGNEIGTVAELPKALKQNYPNLVANYYRLDGITTTVSKGNMHSRESLQLGDSTLLTTYGFKLLHGDVRTAMKAPFTTVVTRKIAQKYFGKTDVLGQTLNFENFNGDKHDFTITGVLDDIPQNTVTSIGGINEVFVNNAGSDYFNRPLDGWMNTGNVCFVQLQPGVKPAAVERAMKQLMDKNVADDVIRTQLNPYLVKLSDYHLNANNQLIKKLTSTLSYVALFILFMAIINFVNICIGRSSSRMKEMGVRKVMGGLRRQLIAQFMVESTVLVALSTLISLVIYLIARPYFGDILGKEVPGLFSFQLYVIPMLLAFVLFIGCLAGLYPALVLSALRSVDSLKGKLTSVKESVLLRKSLVVFQFAIAVMVFVGTMIMSQQISLFFSNDLGYTKDNVVYAPLPRDWSLKGVQRMEYVRSQLAQVPQVRNVSVSFEIPDGHNGSNYMVFKQGADPSTMLSSTGLVVDQFYADTYDLHMKAGSFFKPIYSDSDVNTVVINETQAKALGWEKPEDAINQKIILPAYGEQPYIICGVTADFYFGSVRNKIAPMTFMNVNYANYYRFISIKLKGGDMQSSLAAIKKKWGELMPDAPFEYNFMDEALGKVYATELQLKKAAALATVLSIIIVLLGVIGSISLSIQKRTREIGIRKVLGATVNGVIMLFMKDLLVTVMIAGIVACPLAYLLMSQWLNGYTSRISITPVPFAVTLSVLTVLTMVLIILQTIKTALANPVKSLRVDG